MESSAAQAVLETARPLPADGLEINRVKDGLIIYARPADRVHYLNPIASAIFELCDGTRSISEIATLLATAFELPAPPLEDVLGGVRQLVAEQVLTV